jgi:hypothetical protein
MERLAKETLTPLLSRHVCDIDRAWICPVGYFAVAKCKGGRKEMVW